MSKQQDVSTINLSFAGCGFLCIYHAGVVAAIKEYAPQLTSNRISGASAGAIAAAGLLCNVCLSKSMEIILNVVRQARAGSLRALSPTFNLIGMVRAGLEQILPPNAHLICTGRLFISLTRARDYKNVVVSQYRTREELIQAIVCSSFIPFYCGRNPPVYRGEAYIDGGLSDNQPNLDKYTISVSPFSGESDICPKDVDSASIMSVNFFGTSIRCTSANLFRMVVCLFPPSQDICADICRQGFIDTMRFLLSRGLAPCRNCLSVEAQVFGPAKLAAQKMTSYSPPLPSSSTLRRIKTMPNFAKPKRIEECDRCLEKFEVSQWSSDLFDLPLPELVQKTLDDALAAESTWYRYLRKYMVFRYAMHCMTPVFLPLELMLYTARTIHGLITTYTSREFYLEKFRRMADFVLAEIDSRNVIFNSSSFASTSARILEPYWTNEMRDIVCDPVGGHQHSVDRTVSLDERIVLSNHNSSSDEYHSAVSHVSSSIDSPLLSHCRSDDDRWIQDLRLLKSPANADSPESQNYSLPSEDYKANNNAAETLSDASAAGDDSGLSLTDDSTSRRNLTSIRKRDSACSPIRRPCLQRFVAGTSTPRAMTSARSSGANLHEGSSSSGEDTMKTARSQVTFWRHAPNGGGRADQDQDVSDDEFLFVHTRQLKPN